MTATADRLFEDATVRERFLAHYDSLRGKVRTEVIRRHLQTIVLDPARAPLRVLDVGCGDGRDALWLAGLGHQVIGFDASDSMLQAAEERLAEAGFAGVQFHRGDACSALSTYGAQAFDLVLSHGVLMYQQDPGAFVAEHLDLVRDNGTLSLLAKNSDALAFRAAHEASLDEAIRLLDDSQSLGHLGVPTGAQTIQRLADIGFAAGATVRSWAGVRMFTDTPSDILLQADDDKVVELEWLAARRDPYRRTAALLHVLLVRGVDLGLLPA